MKKLCKDIKLRMCDNIVRKEANANYLHRDIKNRHQDALLTAN